MEFQCPPALIMPLKRCSLFSLHWELQDRYPGWEMMMAGECSTPGATRPNTCSIRWPQERSSTKAMPSMKQPEAQEKKHFGCLGLNAPIKMKTCAFRQTMRL